MTNAAVNEDIDLDSEAAIAAWMTFVEGVIGEDTRGKIATRTGIHNSTISRWFTHHERARPATVIAFARGYGVDPVDALIAAGYLTEDDRDPPPDPRHIPTELLLQELSRRTGA